MLEFPIEFFDDEVRDGFYVPSIMKHCWASQMEILNTVDEICKKNNINYYIFSGTLIGAIRHGGFIPWDDDIDICMLRKDYMRFIKVIMRDKPEKYIVRNCHTDPTYRDIFTRLQNADEVYMSPEFWEMTHGFVCNSGIDIFPIDYIPSDSKKREIISEELMHLSYIIIKFDEYGLTNGLEENIKIIEKVFRIKIKRDDTIPQQMYLLMEDILQGISRGESKLAHISLEWAQNGNIGIPIECFKNTIRVPFEMATFNAPLLYDRVLNSMFGSYMKSVRVCDIHNYPWYKPVLEEIRLSLGLTDYPYIENLLPESNRHIKWENEQSQKLNKNLELFTEASSLAEKMFKAGDSQSGNLLLERCQELVENVEIIEKRLKASGPERVVFLTYKVEYWKQYEALYNAEKEAGCEMIVMPIPYVRLTELRDHTAEYVEVDGFPDEVELTRYDEFDFNEKRISRIYIQNPHDDQNGAIKVNPFFYSTNIRNYTDELIYIPWFELDKYGEDDERALYMMQFFVRQPGIVAADKILLSKSQEWIRDFYIRDLVEWAGEDTRQIWEDKIQIVSFVNDEQSQDSEKELAESKETDKPKQKSLFYYIGTGQILADPEQMIEKLKKNYDVFEESRGKIKVKLFIECGLKESLARLEPKRISDFNEVCDKYRKSGWCEVIDADVPVDVNNKEMMDNIVNGADAFYGDGGVIMHMFSRAKKPVMMQNIAI